jgi:hypothetical protein
MIKKIDLLNRFKEIHSDKFDYNEDLYKKIIYSNKLNFLSLLT